MDRCFAIGDPHGMLDLLQSLLAHWNPDRERLILLGDMVDRGPQSFQVIQLAKKLEKEYGAIVLKGNHEDMLLTWLENPTAHASWYLERGGMATLHSFLGDDANVRTPKENADFMKQHFMEYFNWLSQLRVYYEWEQYLFVHAGVNLLFRDWKRSSEKEFTMIRDLFLFLRNETGKTIVFGHTKTRKLNPDKKNGVWISPCQTKIGIDGGAASGGFLHGLSLGQENELNVYSVSKKKDFRKQTLFLNDVLIKNGNG